MLYFLFNLRPNVILFLFDFFHVQSFLLLYRSFANYETISPARVTKIQPNKRGPRPIPSLESIAFI